MQATGWSLGTVGFASALMNVPVVLAMLVVCWHSDRRRAPYLHIAAMLAISAIGAIGLAWAFQAGAGQAIVAILAAYCLFNSFSTVVGLPMICQGKNRGAKEFELALAAS